MFTSCNNFLTVLLMLCTVVAVGCGKETTKDILDHGSKEQIKSEYLDLLRDAAAPIDGMWQGSLPITDSSGQNIDGLIYIDAAEGTMLMAFVPATTHTCYVGLKGSLVWYTEEESTAEICFRKDKTSGAEEDYHETKLEIDGDKLTVTDSETQTVNAYTKSKTSIADLVFCAADGITTTTDQSSFGSSNPVDATCNIDYREQLEAREL